MPRKLGRTTDQRLAMLRAMVTNVIEFGRIETTITRAREVGPLVERMITLGKQNTLSARRAAMAFITKEDAVKKLFEATAPGYAERQGGYTRVTRLGPRRGDAAEMAVLELV
ncbi:MAG: 50S ribosomal protein L17 [Oscillospiraceae bacterium]|jgi:large subunit ribosomal protein L17|nr:50S ribosomal protein L17 [Oscillospiraceae bacterium]